MPVCPLTALFLLVRLPFCPFLCPPGLHFLHGVEMTVINLSHAFVIPGELELDVTFHFLLASLHHFTIVRESESDAA